MSEQKYLPQYYTLGLDLGISSVGWSVVEAVIDGDKALPKRLLDCGVRLFERAEVPKTGYSPNLKRRTARSARRRLRRRKYRLQKVVELLIKHGLIPQFSVLENPKPSPWKLRAEGLDKPLSDQELSRAIYHIVKHRGFKSNRKADTKNDKEEGRYKVAIASNDMLLHEKNYRTYGEMIWKDEKFLGQKRNKRDNYLANLSREGLQEELEQLLQAQVAFGNKKITPQFTQSIVRVFSAQRPFSSGEDILSKVGTCTFEQGEKRAPLNAPTFERFRFWQLLNNTSLYNLKTYEETGLTLDQKNKLWQAVLLKKKFTYEHVRKITEIPPELRFRAVRYSAREEFHKSEGKTFAELKGYHTLLSHLSPQTSEKLKGNFEQLDTIAEALTFYKTDEEVSSQLTKITILSLEDITRLLEVSFSKFGYLSLRAIRKILPFLEQGHIYSEAVELAGYVFAQQAGQGQSTKLLPIDTEKIKNPVVIRSLTQARKVVNAVIDKYGPPTFIHIELARDLSKSFSERGEIEKIQKENQAVNEKLNERLEKEFHVQANGENRLKLKLWLEQTEKCAYSQKYISPDQLFAPNVTQIDHVLPFSRSLDDSYLNKVLVFVSENQNKKSQTPWEYFGSSEDSEKWLSYQAFVQSLAQMSPRKKIHLLTKEFPFDTGEVLQKFTERNLNDTRYITSFFKELLDKQLKFTGTPGKFKRRVFTFNGRFTAVLRWRWGLGKNRSENDRHHAQDATVVACSSNAMIAKVISLYRNLEEGRKLEHFESLIQPWEGFREEVEARIFSEDFSSWLTKPEVQVRYKDTLPFLHPLFVSRAPSRKVTGAAHEETLYSAAKFEEAKQLVVRKPLPKDHIEVREMFGRETPVYTKFESKPATLAVPVNNGKAVAKNDSMVRVDIFQKDGKHYLVPVYVSDTVKKELPSKAIVAHKSYEEWIQIDHTFHFVMSVYPKEYLVCKKKNEILEGYYIKTHSGSGDIFLLKHDGSGDPQSIGSRNLTSIEKYQIDVLGNKYLVKSEVRRDFSKRRRS